VDQRKSNGSQDVPSLVDFRQDGEEGRQKGQKRGGKKMQQLKKWIRPQHWEAKSRDGQRSLNFFYKMKRLSAKWFPK
jgi:hypothetical protein